MRSKKVNAHCLSDFPLTSQKMRASCEPRRASVRRPKSPFFPWSFVKILLMALEVRLPTSFGRSLEMIGRRTVAGQGADRPEPRAGVGGGFAWWVGWEARGWVDPMGGGGCWGRMPIRRASGLCCGRSRTAPL